MNSSAVIAAIVGAVGAISAGLTNWWTKRRTDGANAEATAVQTALSVVEALRDELTRKSAQLEALDVALERERSERLASERRCEHRIDELVAAMRAAGVATPEDD